MSAAEHQRAEWLDGRFWDRLDRLEDRLRHPQSEHKRVRRGLEPLTPTEDEQLRQAWQDYCDVIAELDRATADVEALRICAT
jgi:hypothetical protein